jgi:hypothetical protein
VIGRKKPYTQVEIAKQRCPCGRPARYQWNCCAINNRWVPVCRDCDVGMNEMVLAFFRVPERARLMAAYRRAA